MKDARLVDWIVRRLKPAKRKMPLVLLGALGGLLGGFGAAIVLTQSGDLSVDLVSSVSIASILGGAAFGYVDFDRSWHKYLAICTVTVATVVVWAGGAQTVGAQGLCGLTATIDGRNIGLADTSRPNPLVLDVGSEPTIEFTVEAPGVAAGTVEATVVAAPPLDFVLPLRDHVVYYDEIDDGVATGSVSLSKVGSGRYLLSGEGWTTPLIPFGLVETQVVVVEHNGDEQRVVCRETVWIRAVATPLGNTVGQAGLALTMAGAVLILVAGPFRRLVPSWRTIGVPVRVTSARIVEAGLATSAAASSVAAKTLLAGFDYELRFTLSPNFDEPERADQREDVVLETGDVEIRRSVQVGIAGVPLAFPFTPRRRGRYPVAVRLDGPRGPTLCRLKPNVVDASQHVGRSSTSEEQ